MPISKNNKGFTVIISILLAALTSISPLAIDTYLSAMPEMAEYFGVEIGKIQYTLTFYFLGFAIGNFFGGPLSDRFGRKTIALIGAGIFMVSAFIIPFCAKVEQIWILRTLQATGGGFVTVTIMVFIRDWFEGKQVARLATIISMIMMLAPLLAPVIGSILLKFGGWRLIFFFLGFYAVIAATIFLIVMPESLPKERRLEKFTVQRFLGNYLLFFKEHKAVFMLFTMTFSSAGMFVFITSSSYIYLEYFGFHKDMFPLLFGSNVFLFALLSLSNTYLLKKYNPESLLKLGIRIQLVASILLAASTLMPESNFVLIFACIVIYIGSLGLIFGNGTAVVLNLTPHISGSANATLGVTRFVFSFLVASIPALFHTGNLAPIGLSILGCGLLANIFYLFFERKNAMQESSSSAIV